MSGSDGLAVVETSELSWLIDEAGPRFLAGARNGSAQGRRTAPRARDQSGSGHGFRFFLQQARAEAAEADALAWLLEEDGPAGEWARRSDERQLARAWGRASALAEEERRRIQGIMSNDDDDDDDGDELDDVEPRDSIAARLNQRHAVVMLRGKGLISTENEDGSIDFGTIRDLDCLYANLQVPSPCGRKTEAASRRWFRSPARRTYRNGTSFCFGTAPAGTLNLWRGWAVLPDSTGSCELFLWHVEHIICGGDVQAFQYVIGWLAHMVQRPHEKPGVALIIKGTKGIGKDTFAEYVSKIMHNCHSRVVAQMSHVVGKFNGGLEGILFMNVQEAIWAGDRQAEGVLKYLITSETVEIERKGIDSYKMPSFLRICMSANANWVVPASADERRYAVVDASDVMNGNGSYFLALRDEMEGRGPAALLHYLANYDLSNLDVRRPPITQALSDQKLQSLKGFDRWWFDVLSDGAIETADGCWELGSINIARDELRAHFGNWIHRRRWEGDPIGPKDFGERLAEVLKGAGLSDFRPRINSARPWHYRIPNLRHCREAFCRWLRADIKWPSVDGAHAHDNLGA